MNFLPLAVFMLFSTAPDPDADFFLAHARADPEVRIEDAYKWLHQATRGGEHALADEAAARQWLNGEWATLGPPQPNEPLWVPLTPDCRIGRLKLRPYRARGGSTEAEGRALLYRLTLRSLLEEQSHITVVEREALESVLKEMEIGSSDLADPSAQLRLGRFLPAGFLLMGDVWPETGRDNLYLRIVDTETSRILASFSSHPDSSASLLETCRELAGEITQTLQDKAGTNPGNTPPTN